jgi:dihydroflavonol-4-reductase
VKPAALVTGATGFVGAALARDLAQRGHAVHALARASSDRSALSGVDVRWHAGDLEDAASVERAVAAVCAAGERPWIAHSAAVISYRTRDTELQRRVNVEGTRALLDACRRHPVGRVLHISSVVAVGHARPGELLDEDAPFNGAELGSDYVDTKRAAEELALRAAAELDLVVVNPGAIFGPNPRGGNTGRFLRELARGAVGPFAPPGSLSVVGVGDVAHGCVLALERGARGRRYLLVESAHTALEAFRVAARLLGVRAPRWTVPPPLWRPVVLAAGAADALRPTEVFTPHAMRLLGVHFRFHAERARAELGWRPRPFEEVLRATIDELHSRGALGRP